MAEQQPASSSSSSSPRSLPPRPSLEFLRKTAKERLREMQRSDPAVQLADAQLATAREYGFASWRALVQHVESMPSPASLSEEDRQKLLARFRGAINAGRVDEVRTLLQTEPAVAAAVNDPIFAFDQRPVAAAASRGDLGMVDLLLEYGADINLKSAWWAGGWGILETVSDDATADALVQRGAVVDVFAAAHLNRIDRLRQLLDADPALVNARGGDGCRPLHFAWSAEAIDLLLACGAEIDARDVDHAGTPAQWAVPRPAQTPPHPVGDRRSLGRVRLFVERGAAQDVFMAAALDDVAALRRILDRTPNAFELHVGGDNDPACPKAPGGHIYTFSLGGGKTPYQVAADFGSRGCLALLLDGATARQRLLAAVSTGDEAGARALLAAQPGVLASLAPGDHALLPHAAWTGSAGAVRLMLDLGFDPLAAGPDTGTALHCAAWQGRLEIVRLILDHAVARGRDLVNAVEPTHRSTPLGWCCHGSTVCKNPAGDYPGVAEALLRSGAVPGPNLNDASEAVRQVIRQFSR